MAITRSKEELARIVGLLESDQYDTAEALAYAVLKEAAEILTARHLWAVRPKGSPVWWGPYYTLTQAEKAWTTQVGPIAGGADGGELARIAPWREEALDTTIEHARDVCTCGHVRGWHTTEGKRAYCGPKTLGCRCATFTRAES